MLNSHKTLLIVLLVFLAGCSYNDTRKDKPQTPASIIYSPNGEPLNGGVLGHPTCEVALSGWVNRVSGGTGNITKDVFMADARNMFTRMDIDHNGYIVSEELDRFREPYRQEQPFDANDKDSARKEGKHFPEKGSHDSRQTVATDPFDPVMSADINLDFKVTPDEFTTQAQDVFNRLDQNHDGMLTNDEVLTLCPKHP